MKANLFGLVRHYKGLIAAQQGQPFVKEHLEGLTLSLK